MSDAVIISIIQGLFSLVSIFLIIWLKSKIDKKVTNVEGKVNEVVSHVDNVHDQVDNVHKQINSRMDELLNVNKQLSRAEGKIEGIQQANDNNEKNK